MDNTKLVAKALDRPALTRMGHRQQLELAESLARALEAAEAELTRRARVIGHDELSTLCLSYLRPPKFSGSSWTLNPDALATAILERLAAAPVSLEAVKAETTTEWGVRWSGFAPHSVTSDLDPADVLSIVRAHPNAEAVVRQVTEWRPVETEGDTNATA